MYNILYILLITVILIYNLIQVKEKINSSKNINFFEDINIQIEFSIIIILVLLLFKNIEIVLTTFQPVISKFVEPVLSTLIETPIYAINKAKDKLVERKRLGNEKKKQVAEETARRAKEEEEARVEAARKEEQAKKKALDSINKIQKKYSLILNSNNKLKIILKHLEQLNTLLNTSSNSFYSGPIDINKIPEFNNSLELNDIQKEINNLIKIIEITNEKKLINKTNIKQGYLNIKRQQTIKNLRIRRIRNFNIKRQQTIKNETEKFKKKILEKLVQYNSYFNNIVEYIKEEKNKTEAEAARKEAEASQASQTGRENNNLNLQSITINNQVSTTEASGVQSELANVPSLKLEQEQTSEAQKQKIEKVHLTNTKMLQNESIKKEISNMELDILDKEEIENILKPLLNKIYHETDVNKINEYSLDSKIEENQETIKNILINEAKAKLKKTQELKIKSINTQIDNMNLDKSLIEQRDNILEPLLNKIKNETDVNKINKYSLDFELEDMESKSKYTIKQELSNRQFRIEAEESRKKRQQEEKEAAEKKAKEKKEEKEKKNEEKKAKQNEVILKLKKLSSTLQILNDDWIKNWQNMSEDLRSNNFLKDTFFDKELLEIKNLEDNLKLNYTDENIQKAENYVNKKKDKKELVETLNKLLENELQKLTVINKNSKTKTRKWNSNFNAMLKLDINKIKKLLQLDINKINLLLLKLDMDKIELLLQLDIKNLKQLLQLDINKIKPLLNLDKNEIQALLQELLKEPTTLKRLESDLAIKISKIP